MKLRSLFIYTICCLCFQCKEPTVAKDATTALNNKIDSISAYYKEALKFCGESAIYSYNHEITRILIVTNSYWKSVQNDFILLKIEHPAGASTVSLVLKSRQQTSLTETKRIDITSADTLLIKPFDPSIFSSLGLAKYLGNINDGIVTLFYEHYSPNENYIAFDRPVLNKNIADIMPKEDTSNLTLVEFYFDYLCGVISNFFHLDLRDMSGIDL